ncbi:MAG TPA: hypothetical protein VMO26_24780 [Vicinamibacterales bacterium]|nr:hypothetical protein [Vicinamibacterales bacterium]
MELPNHHLWWNRGSWWVAFTVLHDGYRQERVRRPLGTSDVAEARARRDRMMDAIRNTPGCRLSLRRSPQPAGRLSPHAATPQPGVTHD